MFNLKSKVTRLWILVGAVLSGGIVFAVADAGLAMAGGGGRN